MIRKDSSEDNPPYVMNQTCDVIEIFAGLRSDHHQILGNHRHRDTVLPKVSPQSLSYPALRTGDPFEVIYDRSHGSQVPHLPYSDIEDCLLKAGHGMSEPVVNRIYQL